MPMKRFGVEQIVTLLRRIEVTMDQGKSTWLACRGAGISEQKFYRWHQKYGGLDLDQPRADHPGAGPGRLGSHGTQDR